MLKFNILGFVEAKKATAQIVLNILKGNDIFNAKLTVNAILTDFTETLIFY